MPIHVHLYFLHPKFVCYNCKEDNVMQSAQCCRPPRPGPTAGSVAKQEIVTLVGPMITPKEEYITDQKQHYVSLLPYQGYTVTLDK